MRLPLLLGLILLATSVAAPADAKTSKKERAAKEKDGPIWAIAKAEDAYVLRYGPARSLDPQFAAACHPGADLLQITVEVADGKIKAGDGVAVSLVVGRRRLELAATAFRGAREGRLVVEAAVSLEARVIDLFAAGDELKITMPGAHESIPLAGAKAKLADFKRVCLPGAREER